MDFTGYFSRIGTDGITQQGVDRGPKPGTIMAENAKYIIVKWPGHTYWVGNYMPRSYAPTEYTTFEILGVTDAGSIKMKPLIGYENKRRGS